MDLQPRINSKYLSHHIGRHVLLMAEINEELMQRQQQQPVVKASDGGNVLVHLPPGESFETFVLRLFPFSPHLSLENLFKS
jgi:hypothetical protein